MILQVFVIIFLLFAISRVILRFRGGQIKLTEFGFWGALFTTAIVVILYPEQTTRLANNLGIGRGVDLVVYASIITLFYLVFRIYVMIEDIRQEITQVIRRIALRQTQGKPPK